MRAWSPTSASRAYPVYFGDASRAELLERAGARGARAFIVTLDEADAAERMVTAVHKFRERCRRAGARHRSRGRATADAAGAVEVVPETFEASLQLGGRVLEVLGASDDAVAHRLASMRDEFEEAIKTGAPRRTWLQTPHAHSGAS